MISEEKQKEERGVGGVEVSHRRAPVVDEGADRAPHTSVDGRWKTSFLFWGASGGELFYICHGITGIAVRVFSRFHSVDNCYLCIFSDFLGPSSNVRSSLLHQ